MPDSENMDIPQTYPSVEEAAPEEVVPTPTEEKKSDQAKQVAEDSLKAAQDILKEYGGLLSDVPHNSAYWTLMNQHSGAYEQWKRLSALGL